MRITGLANVSTASLSEDELAANDALLGRDPRLPVDYQGITVVAHPYGCLAHTCMVIDVAWPDDVSDRLWELLSIAEHAGCDWSCSIVTSRGDRMAGYEHSTSPTSPRNEQHACMVARLHDHRRGPSA